MGKYIPNDTNVKTVSDLRENPVLLLNYVNKTKGPVYILHRSKPMAALVDLDTLAEVLETQQATESINEAIKTSTGEFIDYNKLDIKLRNKHGLSSPNRKKTG